MRFVLAGASGLLGTTLRQRLQADGHEVIQLVRGEPADGGQRRWNPYAGDVGEAVDPGLFEAADAMVNLGGSPLIGNPWSSSYRWSVRQSRVATTSTAARAVAAALGRGASPVLIAANGTSYYGDRGSEVLTEDSGTRGDHLLTSVTRDWQAATLPAAEAGARVCVLRTAPVIDRRSGALRAMRPAFRLGMGGPLGSGRQYFPIVAAEDWASAVIHLATREGSEGPYNVSIPDPPTNQEFTRALGRAVHRPTALRVPAFAIRAAAGPLAPEVLGSVRAIPAKLTAEGFVFDHPDVASVLRAALR